MGYRNSLTTGSRSNGKSASAKHKYQTRQDKYLESRTGVRDDLVAQGSGNLPAFANGDPNIFWLAVDSFERKNARLFVEMQLNLPAELTLPQQIQAVKSYMSELCDKENLSYSWVIHSGHGQNPHAHVMINEQKNDLIDRPAEQHFKRWNGKYPERGGAKKSATLKPKQWLLDARGQWAIAVNNQLEKAGLERRFDHRSLKDQRTAALLAKDWRKAAELDREVGQHEGHRVAALRSKYESDLIDKLPKYARQIIESNNNIQEINAAHHHQVNSMSDVELKLMQREDYFSTLAEHEHQRFVEEIEQLHSDALELNTLHDAHSEALELDAVFDQHSEALELDAVFDQHSEALDLDAIFDQHSKALELNAVFDQHSEALDLDAIFDQHSEALELNAVFEQHSEALKIDALYESRNKLKAHDVVLEQLTKQLQKANHFALEQVEKLNVLEKEYKKLHSHEKKLETQATEEEPAALLSLIAKGVRYQTKSDKLREAASQLAQQRLLLKEKILEAKTQAASSKTDAVETKKELSDAKTHRATLVYDVLLSSGSNTLKKYIALEVKKIKKIENDFMELVSEKAFELQERRKAITAASEPNDVELLQQIKDLQKIVFSSIETYYQERSKAASNAKKEAEKTYELVREALREAIANKLFDTHFTKGIDEQLKDDRAHYFELMQDHKTLGNPKPFKELQQQTESLLTILKEHTEIHEQNAEERKYERQQQSAPSQSSSSKRGMRL